MIASRRFTCSPRRLGPSRLGAALLVGALWPCSRAFAQAEAQKPAPNVLLLVDSSGSMEFKVDGSPVDCAATSPREKSRWIDMVEVLTGSFEGYSCLTEQRDSVDFKNEFSLGGVRPYDFGYLYPYHRALSNDCTYGPGVVPPASTPYAWPNRAVNTFPVVGNRVDRSGAGSLSTYTGCSGFSQSGDGLLDVYKDLVRFGLMTFDARVGSGTGVSGTAADYSGGLDGNWSYYLGSPMTGHPANCSFDMDQEVGARNAAAPPWEGRMIGFGPPNETDSSIRNQWIQEVLLSTRPYGATPIAGQLDDAREFLFHDNSTDPLDSTQKFGPNNDPNWLASNCRKTILILLTDGEPNLDLRRSCEAEPAPPQTAGRCPYKKPEDIVASLRGEAPQSSMAVETYVVGFALGRVTPAGGVEKSCADLSDAECVNPLNNVANQTQSKNIQACCTLNKIAAAGGVDARNSPRKAYFAENRAELKSIFTDILDDVIQVATRTMPVFSSPGGDTASKGFKFFSAFDPRPDPTETQLWTGILERRRFVCSDTLVPELQYDPADGDDFAANLNSGAGDERHFYTVIGGSSSNSMRPYLGTDTDNLGTQSGTQVLAQRPSELASLIPATAMGMTSTTPAASCPTGSTGDGCRDLIVDHLVGLRNADGKSRCTASGCQVFGAIYHSVPTSVPGRPSELLRDESYEQFGRDMATLARPSVLYTSTVDGFLHAFNLAPFPGSTDAASHAVDSQENNELWSFIPPAVLPVLNTQYPKTPMVLLDGAPIIKDVVATLEAGTVKSYERLQADAESGAGSWRSVLVQGFGDDSQVGGGYFALDITDPRREGTGKPQFRWQLTRNSTGKALFGSGGTPLITTVFLNSATGGPREVPVAVLPGGNALPDTGAAGADGEIIPADPATFTTTRAPRKYREVAEADRSSRSLTIVRLDTGAVIRTFRPAFSSSLFSTDVFTLVDIPAPITGQPKAFPDTTGSVADRIYVGDRDGRLWRVDVSSQNPSEWDMKVFYDAFAGPGGTTASSQPVILPPVLSVDDVGDVTVAFATGNQDLDNSQNRVISLTERLDEDNEFQAHVNWIHQLELGDRVTGPMVLFNAGLYYAVSRPPETTGSACDVGRSKVYGAHYIESADFEVARERGDKPDPTTGPGPAPNRTALLITSQPGLVFGLSLEAEPTCVSEEETVGGNESFGYGAVKMSRTVKPGKYFLTFDASGNNTGSDARGVLEVRQELEHPRLPVSFSSWTAVYE
jgi:type IV pilus assembly protein PilY1